jgi:hypothetical protein
LLNTDGMRKALALFIAATLSGGLISVANSATPTLPIASVTPGAINPVTTVAGILGHASTQMTLDVYGHWYQNDANTWMDRISVGLNEPLTDWERTKSAVNLTSSNF